jgi:hypothetical protein
LPLSFSTEDTLGGRIREMNTNNFVVSRELDLLQRETFSCFLHETNSQNGLVRDKTAPDLALHIAATGLALAVYA